MDVEETKLEGLRIQRQITKLWEKEVHIYKAAI